MVRGTVGGSESVGVTARGVCGGSDSESAARLSSTIVKDLNYLSNSVLRSAISFENLRAGGA